MRQNWQDAFTARRKGIACAKYPSKGDERARYPSISPRFTLRPGTRVFTIGSCFARNIEERLTGFDVPTLRFTAPATETPNAVIQLLNEYNPGTMSQRILRALAGQAFPDETLVPARDGFLDLMLPGGHPVTFDRALERRKQIDSMYAEMRTADVVLITLGFVEAWFDTTTDLYLNQMPPQPVMAAEPDRFMFERMGVDTVLPLLETAMRALGDAGLNVLLTVSPVPISSSFSGQDVVLANEYSKSVLRVCAQAIWEKFPHVDYFPSYEIVRFQGDQAYDDDNVHVKDDVVGRVTDYMLSRYLE